MAKKETKSRKLNSLIKPSIYEKLKTLAENEGQSVNETLNEILEWGLEQINKRKPEKKKNG